MSLRKENHLIHRLTRYFRYLFQWIFLEKIRGLDFTMTDLRLSRQTSGIYHGYSKTDEAHTRMILNTLGADSTKSLLDVGCGKGSFLRIASQYPFHQIAGIEIMEDLLHIAQKNFRILKLSDRITLTHTDALSYEHYHLFNVFYFFNPFREDVMISVLNKIICSQLDTFWVILHNPSPDLSLEELGGIELHRLFDQVKSYETVIYQFHNVSASNASTSPE